MQSLTRLEMDFNVQIMGLQEVLEAVDADEGEAEAVESEEVPAM